jgi:hypothetical protein
MGHDAVGRFDWRNERRKTIHLGSDSIPRALPSLFWRSSCSGPLASEFKKTGPRTCQTHEVTL